VSNYLIAGKTKNNKADLDNHANQLNKNNVAYWKSRGYESRPSNWQSLAGSGGSSNTKANLDNNANQLNPNNQAYLASRSGGENKAGGGSKGGGGTGAGGSGSKGGGGGKGSGGGNWPSTTGNPSGGVRGNNPPSK